MHREIENYRKDLAACLALRIRSTYRNVLPSWKYKKSNSYKIVHDSNTIEEKKIHNFKQDILCVKIVHSKFFYLKIDIKRVLNIFLCYKKKIIRKKNIFDSSKLRDRFNNKCVYFSVNTTLECPSGCIHRGLHTQKFIAKKNQYVTFTSTSFPRIARVTTQSPGTPHNALSNAIANPNNIL